MGCVGLGVETTRLQVRFLAATTPTSIRLGIMSHDKTCRALAAAQLAAGPPAQREPLHCSPAVLGLHWCGMETSTSTLGSWWGREVPVVQPSSHPTRLAIGCLGVLEPYNSSYSALCRAAAPAIPNAARPPLLRSLLHPAAALLASLQPEALATICQEKTKRKKKKKTANVPICN